MSHLFFYIFIIITLPVFSQKRWTGIVDNQWENPLNWTDQHLPSDEDDVILDNFFQPGSYTVMLPSQHVMVKSITITPATNNTIELVLSNEVTTVPALTITGPGYGLTINNGGIFRNSSGASSGIPFIVNDSIRVNNGGKFIINTPRAHASNVDRLSALPETQNGTVEFNIPVASSTISLSGRTYGRLVLKSDAYGRPVNYTAAGTNKVRIRSDLQIGDSVTFNLNFSDTLTIGGDLLQSHSTFNIGNASRALVVAIRGNIEQDNGSIITETGSVVQKILLNGEHEQQIDAKGVVNNEIEIIKNGEGNARLLTAWTLPFALKLIKGNIISSVQNSLVLSPSCIIEADTVDGQSHIDGPLTKLQLQNENFLFPVGDGLRMRWVKLLSATGTFTVEYKRLDPHVLSDVYGEGIERLSKLEYWNIQADNASQAEVRLSFNDPHSGGVTDLTSLRAAHLESGIWVDKGNTGFGGSAGSNGWVNSSSINNFSTHPYFALASSLGWENPLPVNNLQLSITRKKNQCWFAWTIDTDHSVHLFKLEESADNVHYYTIYSCPGEAEKMIYTYSSTFPNADRYYRVQAVSKDGSMMYRSKVNFVKSDISIAKVNSTVIGDWIELRLKEIPPGRIELMIYNVQGVVQKRITLSHLGANDIHRVAAHGLMPGVYYLHITDPLGRGQETYRLFKR